MLKVRVLVVDDSLTIRAMFQEILGKDREIEVVGVAANAEEAHTLLAEKHPDVMTLDIEMPGVGGLQFLTKVMHETPLPVIMVSSQTPREAPMRADAMKRGAVACLNKANLMRDAEIVRRMLKKAAGMEVHRIA